MHRIGGLVCSAGLSLSAVAAPDIDVAGDHRARFEAQDGQFRPGLDRNDDAILLRTSVTVAASWPGWKLTGELLDSRAYLNDTGSLINTTIVNALEPIQLKATRQRSTQEGRATRLSLGRMTFDLGTRRLVARSRYRNSVNSFLGVDWQHDFSPGRSLRAFYLKPMQLLPAFPDRLLDNDSRIDEPASHTDLVGLHYGSSAFRSEWQFEIYGLKLDANEAGDRRDLLTLGGRVFLPAAPGRLFWDLELVGQSGTSTGTVNGISRAGLEHDAYFVHAEVGYRWTADWAPTLSLRVDDASGDDAPDDLRDDRYDTLFGARRFDYGPTGIFGPFARANLAAAGLRLAFTPVRRWRGQLNWQQFRLDSATDAWTTTGMRDASGAAGDSLGRQIEAQFQFEAVPERVAVDLGFVHLAKGSFVATVDPAVSAASDYLYAGVTVSF